MSIPHIPQETPEENMPRPEHPEMRPHPAAPKPPEGPTPTIEISDPKPPQETRD